MIKKIDEATWHSEYENKIYEDREPAVIIFTAKWCRGCHDLIERLKKIDSGSVPVLQMDVDKAINVADAFEVTHLPCVLLFSGGDVYDRYENVIDISAMIDEIQNL